MSLFGSLSALSDSQSFAPSRRHFLQKAASVTALLPLRPQPSSPQLFSSCQAPKPEFWFGEQVHFHWDDEISGEALTETGEVIGVVWNPREDCWEYCVTWLSSTAYPAANYPIYDGNFVTVEELCKL